MSYNNTMRVRPLTTASLYIALALLAVLVSIHAVAGSDMLQASERSSLIAMYDGTAERPYVQRTLLPQLAKAVTALTPNSLTTEITTYLSRTELFDTFAIYARDKGYSARILEQQYLYPLLVLASLLYGCLLAYGLVLRRISAVCFPETRYTPWATSFFGLLVLIPFLDADTKLYDFPALALASLCLLALCTRQWSLYLVAFAVACVNKETAILYTGLFAFVYYPRMERKRFAILLASQCIIYVSAMLIIRAVFSDTPGVGLYFHPLNIFIMGFEDLNNTVHFLAVILAYRILSSHWDEVPVVLRSSLCVLAADIAIYYTCGRIVEYRVLFDAFPGLTVIGAHSLFASVEGRRVSLTIED
jgi:hypothetical protein